MRRPMDSPAALAGAHRVRVTKLVSSNDFDEDTETAFEHQVRRVLSSYAVSFPLAITIAELAFATGRPS
jgi:hypothetical protein